MLNKRSVRIVLSIIISVLLWAYVVGSVNPAATKQIRNIPITINHLDVLGERGLAVSGMGADSIDIEISGARLDLGDIDASDFTATVDLASATRGENELTIILRVPSGIEVIERSLNKVVVTVDDLIIKDVDVTISYNGTFAEDQEGSTLSISNPTISVSGAESIVDTVAGVRGTIDASRLSDTATELTCQLVAINGEGGQVPDVMLSQETVTVRSILSETKAVGVSVEIIDNSSDDLARNTSVPETIYIIGTADVIEKLETIDAEPVDVTNISEDGEIQLEFNLPEGVTIADKTESTKILLTVSPLETKTFTFTKDEIKIVGGKGKMDYSIAEDLEFKVTAMDSKEILDDISKEDISVSIDASTYNIGSYDAQLIVNYEGKLHSLDIAPSVASLTVSEITAATPSDGN